MSFLFPAFLIGGLAVAIPIVLHLLRRDVAPEVPFTAVHLLQGSPIERSKRRRLRDLLLLAARVAALFLLAAAFARPYRAGAVAPARLAIVAIDRSFSMGAPGRFAQARQLAKAAVDDAGAGRIAVIAFDERAEVVAPPGSAADARRAIDAVTPGFGATRYRAVVERAAELAGGDPGTLTLVTDLQRSGWEGDQHAVLPKDLELQIRDVESPGNPDANVAVIEVKPEPATVAVTIRNAGTAAYTGSVSLVLDGRQVASAPAAAAAGTSAVVRVPFKAPATGTLAAGIDDTPGPPADNTRFVLLDAAPRMRVLVVVSATASGSSPLVSSSGFYLSRALDAAAPDESGFETTLIDGVRFSAVEAQALRQYGAVALLSTRGIDRRAREGLLARVRAGTGLLVSAGPDVDPGVLAEMLGWQPAPQSPLVEERARVLAVTDLRHPIFRPFGPLTANLGQVRFDRAWKLPVEGWTVAAGFTDGSPALLERTIGGGHVLVFASDLDRRWNDFPLHPAFVPFVLESVRYAAGVRTFDRNRTIGDAPAGVEATPGVHALADGRQVVLNVDTRESELARVSPGEFADMLDRTESGQRRAATERAHQTEARQSYWQYGLALMLLALVAESIVGRAT